MKSHHSFHHRRHDDCDEGRLQPKKGERSAIDDRRMLAVPRALLGALIGFLRRYYSDYYRRPSSRLFYLAGDECGETRSRVKSGKSIRRHKVNNY